jgi:hypothetical protein
MSTLTIGIPNSPKFKIVGMLNDVAGTVLLLKGRCQSYKEDHQG